MLIKFTIIIILYLYSQQCVSLTSACAAMFLQSHYIPVDGREENEIFAIIREISDHLDHLCKNALIAYACHFVHPPCDPDTGIILYSVDSHLHST